jgi:hypothetical protein
MARLGQVHRRRQVVASLVQAKATVAEYPRRERAGCDDLDIGMPWIAVNPLERAHDAVFGPFQPLKKLTVAVEQGASNVA